MKLTKKKALEICRELWQWLADNPRKWKGDWPGWEQYGEMHDDCPCCQYASQRPRRDCGNCPLGGYWPEGNCSHHESPYEKWCVAKPKRERAKYAKQIVGYCDLALSGK